MKTTMTTTRHDAGAESVASQARFVRAGLIAGVAAAAVNTAVVAVANKSADVSPEVSKTGGPIPLVGFAQVTFVATLIGIGIAAILRRRSARPASLFTRIAIWLTAASMIPPVLVDADASTKVLLIVTHLIAAAIVIPVVVKRLTVR
jgi:Family of unknown function (DUF6069)